MPSDRLGGFGEQMSRMKISKWTVTFGVLLLMSVGCVTPSPAVLVQTITPSTIPSPLYTRTPRPTSTPEPTNTPKPTSIPLAGTQPASGKANVVGRVLWGGLSAEGIAVSLCNYASFDTQFGCLDSATTWTDEDGIFLLTNLSPGDWIPEFKTPGSEEWIYMVYTGESGFLAGMPFIARLEPDKVSELGSFNLVKKDLMLLSPAEQAEVKEPRPVFEWAPYPNAYQYELTLWWVNATLVVETSDPRAILDDDLMACTYGWQVKAYDFEGHQIAEAPMRGFFVVLDQPFNCLVTGLMPADGAQLPSSESITISWNAHPLAAYYKIEIYWDDPENFVVPAGDQMHLVSATTTYTFDQQLKPGKYFWQVYACDTNDQCFAKSESMYLEIIE